MRYLKEKIKQFSPDFVGAIHEIRSKHAMRKHKLKPTPYGFKLAGHRDMQEGKFEPEETSLLKRYLEHVDVFVDVGANIGFFTCLSRSMNKKTIAIEPLKQNLDYLFFNLDANGWEDVEVFPLGLADKPGMALLYGTDTGASLIRKWAQYSELAKRFIPLTTLDILLADRFAGNKLVIKIDVEGAEYQVLRGATRTLDLSPSPVWLLEICLAEYHPDGINPHFSDVFKIFWSDGYQARTVEENSKAVLQADVERWIKNRSREFGGINFLFEKEG